MKRDREKLVILLHVLDSSCKLKLVPKQQGRHRTKSEMAPGRGSVTRDEADNLTTHLRTSHIGGTKCGKSDTVTLKATW